MKPLGLIVAVALAAGCSGETEPRDAEDTGLGQEAPAPTVAAEEAPFVFPARRLAFLHAEMNAIAAQCGTELELEQVQQAARARLRGFLRGFNSSDAKAMRLPPPERMPFTEAEKAMRGPRARWRAGAAWEYGDHLPDHGATEGWARVIGSRDMSSGETLFILLEVPKDTWVRKRWQPGRRRWSYFTEEEERVGIQNLLASRYAVPDQAARNSARFACERLKKAADAALAAGRDPADFHANMRAAIIRAFDKDLEREALRYLAEEGAPPRPLR